MKRTIRKSIFMFLVFGVPTILAAQYMGTGSVTQGSATATTTNLYSCAGGRLAGIGTITATDSTVWTVPAVVSFTDAAFPFASDLYNPCTGVTPANTAAAVAALSGNDIVTVDPNGEVFTAFIFADNYFEMYVNGIAVGKDNVPYTQFNSNIVRFKANRPFTIAMLLVDWEEHLGLGSEANGPVTYHDGDGGMVLLIKDVNGNIVSTTGSEWKAQTFYTAPITDLSCPTENGSLRSSANCSTADTQNGSQFYGLHWARPANWTEASYDDSAWPSASIYTNATVGVNNKPAYTNFTDVFDAAVDDAEFIWSSNLILDNEVIVRHTVTGTTSVNGSGSSLGQLKAFPNPCNSSIQLKWEGHPASEISSISIYDAHGMTKMKFEGEVDQVNIETLPDGIYLLRVVTAEGVKTLKVLKE